MGAQRVGTKTIPLDKVEELTGGTKEQVNYPSFLGIGSKPVRIISDAVIISAGSCLSQVESEWLYNSLRAEIYRHGEKSMEHHNGTIK